MANYVTNTLTVLCSLEATASVKPVVRNLIKLLSENTVSLEEILWERQEDIDESFDRRTFFEGADNNIVFQSAWEPADLVQDQIFEILIKAHQSVIVQNVFAEEADAFWGVRYVFLNDGSWDEFAVIEEQIDEMDSLIEKMSDLDASDDTSELMAVNDKIVEHREQTVARLMAQAESNPALSSALANVVELSV